MLSPQNLTTTRELISWLSQFPPDTLTLTTSHLYDRSWGPIRPTSTDVSRKNAMPDVGDLRVWYLAETVDERDTDEKRTAIIF